MTTARTFALTEAATDEATRGKGARAFADIVGESPVLRSVLYEAEVIAPIEIPVSLPGRTARENTTIGRGDSHEKPAA
jgi:transcriptional regulator with GAF, ATPase, and Fis domain